MNRRFWLLLPTAMLFGSPWMHWLIYKNLLAAWPEVDHSAAHFIGAFGSLGALVATVIIYHKTKPRSY